MPVNVAKLVDDNVLMGFEQSRPYLALSSLQAWRCPLTIGSVPSRSPRSRTIQTSLLQLFDTAIDRRRRVRLIYKKHIESNPIDLCQWRKPVASSERITLPQLPQHVGQHDASRGRTSMAGGQRSAMAKACPAKSEPRFVVPAVSPHTPRHLPDPVGDGRAAADYVPVPVHIIQPGVITRSQPGGQR